VLRSIRVCFAPRSGLAKRFLVVLVDLGALVVAMVTIGSCLAVGPSTAASAATAPSAGGRPARAPRPYLPPVDAPITDHFRPPLCRWCPGNRGIDYATAPGTPVRASAAGTVTFAGPIGADLYVTVQHADGLRTSYSYLATIAVRVGQVVGQGAVVGTAGPSLNFGVRRDDVYLDPELLLAGWRLVPRLVPTDGAAPRPRPAGAVRGPLP
jgi:murein DD-endopeptidase MepM/ murein hydrolase activator NlpD